ncbi:unnamed protein product [Heterobilharzia americana]|nr:unnamed protein product [Heterobilharzia americana]CAH8551777.1 unnamed protein product [Heterobilharzia americana]
MSSDVVLSYHESLLHNSDLDTLREGHFVNDNIITFHLEYLRHTKLCQSHNILLMDPAASHLLKLMEKESVGLVLDPLECGTRDWIFLVINDAVSRVSSGGSHWSLLVYSPFFKCAYHLDSLDSTPNYSEAISLSHKLSNYLGISLVNVKPLDVLKQNNGYDCGIFCMVFIEIICDMILKGDVSWQSGLPSELVSHQVTSKRKSLLECISNLCSANI